MPHTTLHKTFTKKVEKERQQKKAKFTSIKQWKAKACTKLSDNLYSVSSAEEAHKLNRRFWDSKYHKIFLLQGLHGKQRLWRHRWVVAILWYNGGSRPSDKGGGGGGGHQTLRSGGRGLVSEKNSFHPFGPQFGLKIRGAGSPGPSPRSVTVIYKVGGWP